MQTGKQSASLFRPGEFMPDFLVVASLKEYKDDPMIIATLVEDKTRGWRDIMICSMKTGRVRWLRCSRWLAEYPDCIRIDGVQMGVCGGIVVAIVSKDNKQCVTPPEWACPPLTDFQ